MAYGLISLNGTAVSYNPVDSKPVTAAPRQRVDTVGGAYVTDWGIRATDTTGEYGWPVMEWSVWAALFAIYQTPGSVAFVDEFGASHTVVVAALTYETLLPGGGDFVSGVKMTLWFLT